MADQKTLKQKQQSPSKTRHSNQEDKETDVQIVQIYQCKNCMAYFASEETLRSHSCKQVDPSGSEKQDGDSAAVKATVKVMKRNPSEKNVDSEDLEPDKEKGKGPYHCTLCELRFTRKSSLIIHMKTHANEKHKCPLCEQVFSLERSLKKHLKIHTKEAVKNLGWKVKLKKRHQCDVCDKEFKSGSLLDAHYRIHTNERPFLCNVCGMGFKQKVTLLDHEYTHGEKSFDCEKCGSKFQQSRTLRYHVSSGACDRKMNKINGTKYNEKDGSSKKIIKEKMEAKSVEKSVEKVRLKNTKEYQCLVCNKQFRSHSVLDRHHRIHTDERPFVCEVCGTGFKQKRTLLDHEYTHTDQKSFDCEKCGSKFKQSRTLQYHVMSSACDRKVKKMATQRERVSEDGRSEELRGRRKRYHGNEKRFECTVCGKCFKQKVTLADHQYTHRNEKTFACERCGSKFKQFRTLRKHVISDVCQRKMARKMGMKVLNKKKGTKTNKKIGRKKRSKLIDAVALPKDVRDENNATFEEIIVEPMEARSFEEGETENPGGEVLVASSLQTVVEDMRRLDETKTASDSVCVAGDGNDADGDSSDDECDQGGVDEDDSSDDDACDLTGVNEDDSSDNEACDLTGANEDDSDNEACDLTGANEDDSSDVACDLTGANEDDSANEACDLTGANEDHSSNNEATDLTGANECQPSEHEDDGANESGECDEVSGNAVLQTLLKDVKGESDKANLTNERPFVCIVCGMGFKQRVTLLDHEYTHSKEKSFDCERCGSKFKQFRTLRYHVMFGACDRKTNKKGIKLVDPLVLQKNLGDNTNGSGKKISKEKIIAKTSEKRKTEEAEQEIADDSVVQEFVKEDGSKTASDLQCNLLTEYEKAHTGEKILRCEFCYKNFDKPLHLQSHILCHIAKKNFACTVPDCNKKFVSKAKLMAHMPSHFSAKKYACRLCEKTFAKMSLLNVHFRSAHPPNAKGTDTYVCAHCGKKFKHLQRMGRHHCPVLNKQIFQCQFCGKGFSTKALLVSHRRIHTGDRPFKCPECSKCFTLSRTLRDHMVKHTGIKPYACDVCGIKFTRKHSLNKHKLIIHSGVEPFLCRNCGMTFKYHLGFKKHESICKSRQPQQEVHEQLQVLSDAVQHLEETEQLQTLPVVTYASNVELNDTILGDITRAMSEAGIVIKDNIQYQIVVGENTEEATVLIGNT